MTVVAFAVLCVRLCAAFLNKSSPFELGTLSSVLCLPHSVYFVRPETIECLVDSHLDLTDVSQCHFSRGDTTSVV